MRRDSPTWFIFIGRMLPIISVGSVEQLILILGQNNLQQVKASIRESFMKGFIWFGLGNSTIPGDHFVVSLVDKKATRVRTQMFIELFSFRERLCNYLETRILSRV